MTMICTVGMRVGAFQSCDQRSLALFGYGQYAGEEVPPENILSHFGPASTLGVPIAKLMLDDGTILWGCECWWGPEPIVKGIEITRQVTRPQIDIIRRKRWESWKAANLQMEVLEEAHSQTITFPQR